MVCLGFTHIDGSLGRLAKEEDLLWQGGVDEAIVLLFRLYSRVVI